jgi:hypothetical protein
MLFLPIVVYWGCSAVAGTANDGKIWGLMDDDVRVEGSKGIACKRGCTVTFGSKQI